MATLISLTLALLYQSSSDTESLRRLITSKLRVEADVASLWKVGQEYATALVIESAWKQSTLGMIKAYDKAFLQLWRVNSNHVMLTRSLELPSAYDWRLQDPSVTIHPSKQFALISLAVPSAEIPRYQVVLVSTRSRSMATISHGLGEVIKISEFDMDHSRGWVVTVKKMSVVPGKPPSDRIRVKVEHIRVAVKS